MGQVSPPTNCPREYDLLRQWCEKMRDRLTELVCIEALDLTAVGTTLAESLKTNEWESDGKSFVLHTGESSASLSENFVLRTAIEECLLEPSCLPWQTLAVVLTDERRFLRVECRVIRCELI